MSCIRVACAVTRIGLSTTRHSLSANFAALPQRFLTSAATCRSDKVIDAEQVVILRPKPERSGEATDTEKFRARLLYQSRKRGIKENDLLMGTFAHNHLHEFSHTELEEYDVILNNHDNEWDMYYWMVGLRPLPEYLENSEVMKRLVEFSANKNKEMRIELPPLK